jgi:hypothetical protein
MLILARRRFDPRSVSLHESEDSSFPMAVLAGDPTGHRQSLADIVDVRAAGHRGAGAPPAEARP